MQSRTIVLRTLGQWTATICTLPKKGSVKNTLFWGNLKAFIVAPKDTKVLNGECVQFILLKKIERIYL